MRNTPLLLLVLGTLACAGAGAHAADPPAALSRPAPTPAPNPASNTALSISVHADRTAVQRGSDGTVQVQVRVEGLAAAERAAPLPTDLVVVLDKSGSMDGDKIQYARAATEALLDLLGPADRFALITYDDDPRVLRALAPLAGDKQTLIRTIRGIGADGSTNISGGLEFATQQLALPRPHDRMARVVLISDGLPNRGDASPDGLLRRARGIVAREAALTSVGVGLDWDEQLMSQLADAGTGNLHYLQNGTSLAEVFAHELSAAGSTVATNLQLDLRLSPGVSLLSAGGYAATQVGTTTRLDLGPVSGGRTRSIWLTLRVPTDSAGALDMGGIEARWNDAAGSGHQEQLSGPRFERVEDERAAIAGIQKDQWEQAVVQERWGKVQEEVGAALRNGDKAGAKRAVAAYEADVAQTNAHVQSAAVETNLVEARALDASIDDAFTGEDQVEKQKSLGKGATTTAYGSRRGKESVVKK